MTAGNTQTQHSWMGASGAVRWMNCPGSVGLCQKLNPPATTSVYAEEGTKAHAVCEAMLAGAEDWELEFLQATPEMISGAVVYLEAIKNSASKKSVLLVEHRVGMPYDAQAFGTADAIVHNPDILHIFDYKFGMMPVEVEDNPQLRFYAIGAYFSLPKNAQKKIKTITATVVQPRVEHDKGPVRCETLAAEELLKWGDEVLRPAMEACRKPDAPFAAGEWCKYCPVFVHCPINGVVADFSIDESPEVLPEPLFLPIEKIANILKHASRVEDWLAEIRKHAYGLAMNGKAIPGFKLVGGRSSRQWRDEKIVTEVLGDQAFGPRKLISPAQAEKLKLDIDLDSLIVTTPGNPILVPDTSKKQQIASSAESDFQNG